MRNTFSRPGTFERCSTGPPADVPLSGTRDTFSHLPVRQTLTTIPSTENHAIGVIFPSGTYRKAGPEPEKRNVTAATRGANRWKHLSLTALFQTTGRDPAIYINCIALIGP